MQFATCCRMPYSLLFVAACRTICYFLRRAVQFAIRCRMPYSLLFVAACLAVLYSLPRVVQLDFYCRMPYSLLFVATCLTICYLLPHAVVLPHALQYHTVCCLLPHAVQFVMSPHAMQFAICCRMPCSFAICCSMQCSLLSVAACCTARYYSLGSYPRTSAVNCLTTGSTYNRNGLSDKVHCHKKLQ